MEGLEYLIVETICEVNEKGTREKNDGNENTNLGEKRQKSTRMKAPLQIRIGMNLIRTSCQSA